MSISKILTNFALSKPGKALYQWAAKPKSEAFLNNTMPTIETVLSTACYVWSTAKQKDIDEDRRNLLQIQNIGSGVLGVVAGSFANRKISKLTENVIKDLDPTRIDPKPLRQISTGLRIITPILVTGTIMRFLLPTATALFSGKVMDKVREKREQNKVQNNKLDVKG